MKYQRFGVPACVCALAWSWCASASAQTDLDGLLRQLADGSRIGQTVYSLEGQPQDPRIAPALETAFKNAQSKYDKQWIASTLLRLREPGEEYYNYLAGFAKDAVEDRTPNLFSYDDQGRSMRGQLSSAFLNWCAVNNKEPKDVARLLLDTYPTDVSMLARSEDPRAAGIFRPGLDSPDPLVVARSVLGLARLRDAAAIPLVAQAADRLHAGDRMLVSKNLPWFASIQADQLMERLTPDPKTRESFTKEVEQERLEDIKHAQQRQRKSAAK